MRKLILAAVLVLVLGPLKSSKSLPAPIRQPAVPFKVLQIQETTEFLQPALKKSPEESRELAVAIDAESLRYGIEWKLLLSILNQESSLRKDPQGCLRNKASCTGDYGIGQVRKGIWDRAEGMRFDGRLLLTSYAYAVAASAKVLNEYKKQYSRKELDWFTRYHSNKPEFRNDYMHRLNASYSRINLHLDKKTNIACGTSPTMIVRAE